MPNTRLIVLNGNAGAFVDVTATVACRLVQIIEDDAAAAQGLQIKTPVASAPGTFTDIQTFAANTQPISIPDPRRYPNGGPLLGLPAQGEVGASNRREADILFKARSATALATTIRVIENE